MPEASRSAVQFDQFILSLGKNSEPELNVLSPGNTPLPLRLNHRALKVLVHLVNKRPDFVSAKDLYRYWEEDRLKPEPNDVEKAIFQLRSKLAQGDANKRLRFIRSRAKARWNDKDSFAEYAFIAECSAPSPMAQPPAPQPVNVSVFISYPEEHESEATRVRQYLEEFGINVPPAPFVGIDGATKRAQFIRDCDHFLLLHSPLTPEDSQVRSDLGLVLTLHAMRQRQHPQITIISSQSRPTSQNIVPLNADGMPLDGAYDLSFAHPLRLGVGERERLGMLVRQMHSRIEFLTGAEAHHKALFDQSIRVYQQLFPDAREHDDPKRIWDWIQHEQPQAGGTYLTPWRAIYGVYSIADLVVGMTFISGNVQRPYAYGNFFGVLRSWREENRANDFLMEAVARLREAAPSAKAIAFEVETVNFKLLERVAHERPGKGPNKKPLLGYSQDEDAKLLENIRNLRRFLFYDRKNCWVAVHPCEAKAPSDSQWEPHLFTRNPAVFVQPGLRQPYPDNQIPLYFMVRPLEGCDIGSVTVPQLVDFAYDDLYASAYSFAKDSEENLEAQRHVQGVKSSVAPLLYGCEFHHMREVCKEGVRALADLVERAEMEGYAEELTL